jgi:acetolactate synthase-1/2/3 large subunit
VNIVGDHATYHKQYDAQLESDIETVARNVSTFVRTSAKTDEVAADAAETVAAAMGPPGQVATLILPADVSWTDGAEPAAPIQPTAAPTISADTIETIADAIRSGEPTAILVGGRACRADPLRAASRIANFTGAKLLCETFPARLERGAGVVPLDRLAYFAEFAAMQLDGVKHLILADAKAPVSFFAYPGKPSYLVPDGCEVHSLGGPDHDVVAALEALLVEIDAPGNAETIQADARPELPTGPLTAEAVCNALGALMPDDAIVSDEGNTSGLFAAGATAGAPRHDWLCLTGGAIGQGLPVAVGAAVACPDRKVIALQADGSAMYTLQSWWTMAREGLDVTTIIFNNHSYAILNMELNRVGAGAGGPKARDMLDIGRPDLDFVALASGMGIKATRATTADEFVTQLRDALETKGPSVVEAVVPSIV